MRYSMSKKSSLFSPPKAGSAFSPRDREMSACHNSIRKLENKLTEGRNELEETKKENKLLNRLRVRQEKELNRFQSQEGELPQLLNRHTEEVSQIKYGKGRCVIPVGLCHCVIIMVGRHCVTVLYGGALCNGGSLCHGGACAVWWGTVSCMSLCCAM